MKTANIICLLLAATLSPGTWLQAASQQPAAGFIIYTDHPATYVEACEFAKLDTAKPLYSTIVRPDGRELQISNGGLWIIVDYPSTPPKDDPGNTAAANLAKIRQLEQKYPQFKAQLLVAEAKWQAAQRLAAQQPKPAPALQTSGLQASAPQGASPQPAPQQPQNPADSGDGRISFTARDGTKYSNVTISGVDAQGLTLLTDAGIERISFEQVPKDLQERFHYDALKAAMLRDAEWSDNYAAALQRAKAANKLVLLDFTGSDWCHWCMKMKAETLDQQAFKDYAARNLVLVELDFPNNKPQSDALKAQNAELKAKYKPEGFPTFVVVDQYGAVLESISGYMEGGPATFISWLNQARKP